MQVYAALGADAIQKSQPEGAKKMINNIKYWRQELLLSQFDLAMMTGIPRWRIQLLEQGYSKPTEAETELLQELFKKRPRPAQLGPERRYK